MWYGHHFAAICEYFHTVHVTEASDGIIRVAFLEIYDMGIILKVFLSTFTWHLWQRHLIAWSTVAFFGNIWYGYHLKVFFEYCQMVMMSSCPIAFFVGIFNNILGVGNLWDVKSHFNHNVALFDIMCPISSCSAEFSAFYEHFCRFLKFLTLMFQKVFPNYLRFAYVWHYDSTMTMTTWIFSIL